MNKQELRKLLISKRKSISAESKRAQQGFVCSKLKQLIPDDPRNKIAVYAALNDELSVAEFYEICEAEQVFFPVLIGGTMRFYSAPNFDAEFITQPLKKFDESELVEFPQCETCDFTHVIAPLVGFDKNNNRLGYGGGYYDRFLREVSAECKVYGVAFAEQLCDAVPVEEHDLALPDIIYMQI